MQIDAKFCRSSSRSDNRCNAFLEHMYRPGGSKERQAPNQCERSDPCGEGSTLQIYCRIEVLGLR